MSEPLTTLAEVLSARRWATNGDYTYMPDHGNQMIEHLDDIGMRSVDLDDPSLPQDGWEVSDA